jgi:hypothetical protein
VFDFAHLENFSAIDGFPGAKNKKRFFVTFRDGQLVRLFFYESFPEKSSGLFHLLVG